MFRIYAKAQHIIYAGHRGENLARCICFSLEDMQTEFGIGTWSVVFQRPGEALPYVVTNTEEVEKYAVWGLDDTDTAIAGEGRCELRYYIDDVLCKTAVFPTVIKPSLGAPGETPDPYEDLIDVISGLKADAEAAAAAAAESAQQADTVIGESVRWDQTQTLTTEAKATARGNIDAASAADTAALDARITQNTSDIAQNASDIAQNASDIAAADTAISQIQTTLNNKADQGTIARVEATNVATKTYVVGEYLVYGGVLYKVIAGIANGGTIIPGTNCEQDTVGTELKSLRDALSTMPMYVDRVWATASAQTNQLDYTLPHSLSNSTARLIVGTITGGTNSLAVNNIVPQTDKVMRVYFSGSMASGTQVAVTFVYK